MGSDDDPSVVVPLDRWRRDGSRALRGVGEVAAVTPPPSTTDRAALLWSLLHNGASADGRWTPETKRFYEHVIELLDTGSPL